MGITKEKLFTPQQNALAAIAKALAHPARIAILEHLFEQETCVCGGLVDKIGLAQATISQHLRELKTQGIIQGTVEGTSVCYCINPQKWDEIKATLELFLSKKSKQTTDTCC